MRLVSRLPLALLPLLVLGVASFAEDRTDLSLAHQIKAEAFERSKVMEHLSALCDVHGPRLTGSPNFTTSCEWAAERLKTYGLSNVALETWGPFGRSWSYTRLRLDLVEPQYARIRGFPLAWSAGTEKAISSEPIVAAIERKRDPAKDKEEIAKFKAQWKGKLRGRVLLLTKPKAMPLPTNAAAKRLSAQELSELAEAPMPSERKKFDYSKLEIPEDAAERGQYFQGAPADLWEVLGKLRDARNADLHAWLREEGVQACFVRDDRGEGGAVFGEAAGPYKSEHPLALPTFVLAHEDYDRLARLVEGDKHPKVEIELAVKVSEKDQDGLNVIAEIPGDSKKDEVVMVGAHIDSWVGGTGATDNGAGTAVAMEVARILKALDLKLPRTVRIGLWGGEEQGLLGSRAYVAKHMGDDKSMKVTAEHGKLSVYFNLDNGTGKIRGVYLQGNDAARPHVKRWLEPFHDLGASTVTIRNTGGTDHLSFDAIGLPGFQFIQDPLDYGSRTHHSDMDVYDHVQAGDLMQSAAIMAYCVAEAARMETLFPRKPMPRPRKSLEEMLPKETPPGVR
ncbi:MAG: M20/M25/M40 family metallo-hydrolase [Planctomycetota bacterium]